MLLDHELVEGRREMFARGGRRGPHPRPAEVLADLGATGAGTADDQFARVPGLVLDGLPPG
ncbi:hypothetical protein [Pseudonocardia adelaidensis]|uniref:hypothetical protein n=1 Tax=Pseudonocardia adelaidensis TaxID=648754 RepID=UPI0031EA7BF5